MASIEDYDEFGNYIGAELGSDDDEEMQQDQYLRQQQERQQQRETVAPLEGFEEPAEQELTGMEVDGALRCLHLLSL